VSISTSGDQASINASDDPSISSDGTRIAFVSDATNLVAGDTNGKDDVFVHDTSTGTTIRVSVASDGTPANNHSRMATISADGTKVAFISWADNLVAGDTNIREDVFLHDLDTGSTSRVSLAHDDSQVVATIVSTISIDGDGSLVAFVSNSAGFVANDTNGFRDVFIRDTAAGTTTRASVSWMIPAPDADGHSDAPSLSADGTRIAFHSDATNLSVSGDINGLTDVYIRNLQMNTTSLASVTTLGGQASGGRSINPSLSADGTRVAFESRATNLMGGADPNNAFDVFLRDTVTGTTTLVSEAATGTWADDGSGAASISGDGTMVAFHSVATNLIAADTNATLDVFVRDLAADATARVSTTDTGAQAAGVSDAPSLNGDGSLTAFRSVAPLVPTDTNDTDDAYVVATDASLDTDRDGLTGWEEGPIGTDPDLWDTDGDNLSDGDEHLVHPTSPLLADTDGDGVNDNLEILGLIPTDPTEPPAQVALFNPTSAEWHLRSADGSTTTFYYGLPGDVPLMGDWNCDGIDTVGMFRPDNGFVYLRNTNDFGVGEIDFFFGIAGDIPIVGDWDGDGCDSLGVYRGGRVFLTNALATAFADIDFWFGIPGDSPFAGDFDKDGLSEIGLFREATGFAYLRNDYTSGIADHDFFFGIPGDRIVAGDWNNDYTETVGIWRPSEATFYLANTNDTGPADEVIPYGTGTWIPVSGDFN
jgi:Tol biopolymer transport system component